jgi:hypothetical protein
VNNLRLAFRAREGHGGGLETCMHLESLGLKRRDRLGPLNGCWWGMVDGGGGRKHVAGVINV